MILSLTLLLSIMFIHVSSLQGIVDVLCQSCERLGWKMPTKIQKEAIPVALEGKP